MWREQCPGSRIPPGFALAEVEQVCFKLLDFSVDSQCPLQAKLEECSAALSSDLELLNRDRSVFFTSLRVLQAFLGVCTLYFPVKYFLWVVERLNGLEILH